MNEKFEKDFLMVSNFEGGKQDAVPKFNMRYEVVAKYWWERGYAASELNLAVKIEEVVEDRLKRLEERAKKEVKVAKAPKKRIKK